MSVMARYINRLAELQSQLTTAEEDYQTALSRVREIQGADGSGQLMYVPAGGVPIELRVPHEAYKSLVDELTKASVNSAVVTIADLWRAIGLLVTEVTEHIAGAEARAGVAAAPQQFTTTEATQELSGNPSVAQQLAAVGITVPLVETTPPRVRRVLGGGEARVG